MIDIGVFQDELRRLAAFTSVSSARRRLVPSYRGACPSTSRMTRITCLSPFFGGSSFSIASVARTSPTRSLFWIALKAQSAQISAATRAFVARRVPNAVDPDMSTTSMTVISRSSKKTFTNASFMRADTFQSIQRTSSPGW